MSDEWGAIGEDNESAGFSLESILAEVKGSAFINGEKKTPSDVLQEKADKILREAAEMRTSVAPQTAAASTQPRTITSATQQTTAASAQTITSATQQTAAFDLFDIDAAYGIHEAYEDFALHSGSAADDSDAEYGSTAAAAYGDSSVHSNYASDSIESDKVSRVSGFEPEFFDTDEFPVIVTPLENARQIERNDSAFSAFDAAMDEALIMSAKESNADTAASSAFAIPMYRTEQDSPDSFGHEAINISQNRSDDETVLFFDQFQRDASGVDNQDTIIHNLNITDADEMELEEYPEKSKWGFAKSARTLFGKETLSGGNAGADTKGAAVSEEVFEEPELRSAVRRFASACNSISIRILPASVISILMILITYVFEAGMLVPFGIGHNLNYAAGALVICLLVVMMLCSDVIVRGVDFLIKGSPNVETLILFSCAFSIVSAVFTVLSGLSAMLPFCAVSALSLTFAGHGEKYSLRAITDSLKTAAGSSEPYGVQAEYNADIDKSVLKKTYNRTDGFYNNLMQPDITEHTYRYVAPALLIGAVLLTAIIVLFRGEARYSLHILSALLAAAAPFSALLSFSIPFITVAKSSRKSGAAIAGWGGADDIYFTDGVSVTDDDLFPPGMLRLSGVKVYDGASAENAIRYTASLILASGSGLTFLFSEVLRQQGLSPMSVEQFECQESGIGAMIGNDQVSTGSAAFMNLLGVRVPDDTSMKNAVYTAINNRLVAMFAIDYKPLPSVQSALISMIKWRVDLYFAVRDFNVTPTMVGQKFKVPFDSFVFIPAKDSYSISDGHSGKAGRMAAVLIREGLGPFAEAITNGRLLKSAAFFATILSVVSAVLGVLIMFYMCWTGSFISASPGNLILFMLCMLATVLIVCGYVRLKK